MPLPADYHMHTPLCRHAKGEPTEYAARAIEVGLPEIGLSDHSPMREDDFDDWRMRASELTEYASKVDQARLDHPTLPIRFGLEVDFRTDRNRGSGKWPTYMTGIISLAQSIIWAIGQLMIRLP